jgi:hypothetical protein
MHIIQLDQSKITVMAMLKDILIIVSSNPDFHQVIDIVVVNIPKAYNLLLSKDWSLKFQGYFLTN